MEQETDKEIISRLKRKIEYYEKRDRDNKKWERETGKCSNCCSKIVKTSSFNLAM